MQPVFNEPAGEAAQKSCCRVAYSQLVQDTRYIDPLASRQLQVTGHPVQAAELHIFNFHDVVNGRIKCDGVNHVHPSLLWFTCLHDCEADI